MIQLSDSLFASTETHISQELTRRTKIYMLICAFGRETTARELTDIIYGIGKHQAAVFGELNYMTQKGILERTGTSAQYYFNLVEKANPRYFYVFQNRSFEEEYKGGFLWAPKKGKGGIEHHHWSRMAKVKKGDVIFHGYKQRVVGISIAKADAYSSKCAGGKKRQALYAYLLCGGQAQMWKN